MNTKNIITALFIALSSIGFSQTHTDNNGVQSSVIGPISASGAQARKFEVAKIGFNSHHWQYGGIMMVELFQTRHSTGYDKYYVSIGHGNGTHGIPPKIQHVESSGKTHFANIELGTPTDLSSSRGGYVNRVVSLYVNARYYSTYKVKITYLRNKVNTVIQDNEIEIIENPVPINIDDFSVTTVVENDIFSSGNLRISGTGKHYISDGNVGIGTTNPDAKLAVNGNIHTKEVKVDLINWSDFVFQNDYNLPTLAEVEQHIKEKGHLQDIPSAKQVAENGIFLGEMDAKLLQKIEELVLYTINQEKRIEALEDKNEKLILLVEKLLKTKSEG